MKLFEALGIFEAKDYEALPQWVLNAERMLSAQLPEADKRQLEAAA